LKLIEYTKTAVKRTVIKRLLRQDQRRRHGLPNSFQGLPPEIWGGRISEEGHLCVQDISTVTLAQDYGTPLHVVDKSRLKNNHDNFIAAFRQHLPNVELATSYKTNPLPGVLTALHRRGTFAEVISHFELWLALKLGVPPERIIVNGPGKGKDCIDLAVSQGVRLINIDGREEIPWLVDAAQKYGRKPDVGLRLVTSVGWQGQFGTSIATNESLETFRKLKQTSHLNPCALHLHLGTGIKDPDIYLTAITEVLEFGLKLDKELDIKINTYDFGGGFGVPTVRTPDVWDLRMPDLGYAPRMPHPADCPEPDVYARKIGEKFRQIYPDFEKNPPHIFFEPGRAITSSAQTLLLRVITVKQTQQSIPKLILDGGKNITMPLGYEIHQIFPANKMKEPYTGRFDIYGPLCHPGDIVVRCKQFPYLQAGDLVAVMDAGAYFIPNQTNFSLPRPAAVMVDGNTVAEIRRREAFSDIVQLDALIPAGDNCA